MRQKELRIALICYGGVSLAVYMHGVTKEVWKSARASRGLHATEVHTGGTEAVYQELLGEIEAHDGIRLRVFTDILAGASAGGINAIFLAQAIHSGHSLEPLTDLWLRSADVDALIDPAAKPGWKFSKYWAQPLVEWVLSRPGNAVSESVSPETQAEVRRKVSHFMRGRWFEPPFSGEGFSRLIHNALQAMAEGGNGSPLLPPGHPLDLMVTTTDFRGFLEPLHLHSPPVVEESEHRLQIQFSARTPLTGGNNLADLLELTFAGRATASFPGAFPALQLGEIDDLAKNSGSKWPGRAAFLERVMPVHLRNGNEANVSLIDGSVLVNAPFAAAIAALPARPAQREVDRRFVYIDPRPDRFDMLAGRQNEPVSFFGAIFGSLSTIPREQPIRDNLELLEQRSREAERTRQIINGLRPEVEAAVDRLFGRVLFLDRPTPKRLSGWRSRAQQAAAEQAGYAFGAYAQAKLAGIVERMARTVMRAAPKLGLTSPDPVIAVLRRELAERGLERTGAPGGGATPETIAFLRAHDLTFRVRRLRLIARRLSLDWESDPEIPDNALDAAREQIYKVLAIYFARDGLDPLGDEFPALAADVLSNPGAVIDALAGHRSLTSADVEAEVLLTAALEAMPKDLRRKTLLTYLGFPFYDVATLPLLQNEGFTEFEGVKVDRISPDDARAIREGGTRATLRGTEFYNFGAFFSRGYRENDYLWGRLHGAERMIDLICSTVPEFDHARCGEFKRRAFLAILDEEEGRLIADPGLVTQVRKEVLAIRPAS
ncbi:patatin-like protein [Altererythrobacter salegens]|uniref:Patatin-like protein n=1 Tax=Croceibacterium salegens TaxID=1737568 RepID=A0A6I4SWV1_9SPHN|nr:patatin-like protein [Croceibacterium salegens]MXO58832.1 patatin-like protein [Croceibacterium salegens]